MSRPAECRFTESHEWLDLDGDVVTLGITQYAADELTDVTYVEMKPTGTQVRAGETVGEVESVKTTSDVLAAVDGEVIEVNNAVSDDPSLLNRDPYGDGWLVKIRANDLDPLETLLDQATYDARHPTD